MALGIVFQTQDFCAKWRSEGRDPVDARNSDIDDWAYEKRFSFQSLRDAVAILHENGFVRVTAPGSQEEFDQRMKAAQRQEALKAGSDLLMNEMLNSLAYRNVIREGRKAVETRANNDPLVVRISQGNIERQEAEKKRRKDAQKAFDRYKKENEPSP